MEAVYFGLFESHLVSKRHLGRHLTTAAHLSFGWDQLEHASSSSLIFVSLYIHILIYVCCLFTYASRSPAVEIFCCPFNC